MLDRDLKRLAIQVSLMLPDDREMALSVLEMTRDLLENYLFEEKNQAFLRVVGGSSDNVANFIGSPDGSPR